MVLTALLVYSIYLIVKGIVYYKSAEERDATVAEIYDLRGIICGLVYYSFSVDIEDNGEIFNVPVEQRLSIKRIECALKKGDKITVWYLKNSKKCILDRGYPIKLGSCIIAALVVFVFLFFVVY